VGSRTKGSDVKIEDPELTASRRPTNRRHPVMRHRHWRLTALAVALIALGMALAACGGGSSDPPAASGSPAQPGRPSEAELLKYAQCMRSHGLTDFPDPTVGPNGQIGFEIQGNGNSDLNPRSPQFVAARSACQKYMPGGGQLTPAEQAEANVKALEYAQCMRSHGEPDFPDPNGQGLIKINNATGILNPNSPQFEKAQTACQSLDNGFQEQITSSSGSPGGPNSAGGGTSTGAGL
jgi:hypothetical protein